MTKDVGFLLSLKKIRQAEIARSMSVTRSAVNLVINRKGTSRRIQEEIARLLDTDRSLLFGKDTKGKKKREEKP